MSKGGGEAVSLNVIEALQDEHDVTFFTISDPDIDELNSYYDTNVGDIETDGFGSIGSILEDTSQQLDDTTNTSFGRLQCSILKFLIDRKSEYDLIVNTYNEYSFKNQAVQYIHYPNHTSDRSGAAYNAYKTVCNTIEGFSKSGVRKSTLLANSDWTGAVTKSIYGVTPRTVFPPIDVREFEPLPWADRDNGFVCVGRLSPGKNILRNIEIIDGARERGHDVHLHLIGPKSGTSYFNKIKRATDERSYVSLEGAVSRQKLVEMICSHKYGIHGKDNEHFGMAVAELAAGGTVPFAPNSGGQKNILNNRDELLYDSVTDAVNNIDKVLSDTSLQDELTTSKEEIERRFGRERFKNEIREIVNNNLP